MNPAAMTTPSDISGRLWHHARSRLGVLLLGFVAYVPLLATSPGRVGADTKTYLYLDPGRLLARAAWMWDPNVGFGTVTHQNIGYLWPMGPYYWLMDAIGLPDWIAQRLWLGSIILLAGLGVRWMLKELGWDGAGVTVASLAYALSPYLLDYGARISVILLPFMGLPWLIGLMARGLRRGDWRSASWFALVTLTVGGVNATSLLLVMVGPVLWALHATFVAREVTWQRTVGTAARMGLLTGVTSLWWIAGLSVQGRYGIPILRYTETYRTVANASTAPEVLRGLGYWFFYGRDALGAWIAPAVTMTQALPAVTLSFALPGIAVMAGLLTRWRHRGFFALMTGIGLVISVGSHPWDSPSIYGAAFKAWTGTESGLAFRSTPRAVPLVAIGLAVFLGAGVAAVSRNYPKWHVPLAGFAICAVLLNATPLLRGQMVDKNLDRPEEVPSYWREVADELSKGDRATRVVELPGTDFASYRWGNTVDPITPGLTDREFAARELIPYGSPPSADLLNAWDIPLQQGSFDPDTLAPIARLLGVGQIVHRADLQFERFRTPRPRPTYRMLQNADGLGEPTGFGPSSPNTPVAELPSLDGVELSRPSNESDPPAVSVFPVRNSRAVARTESAESPIVLSGDGAGIVALAASGDLNPNRPVLYTSTLEQDPKLLASTLNQPGASLVVTDTNRRQARRWGTVRDNDGYTEAAGEVALVEDAADNRLEVVPGTTDDNRTVSVPLGPVRAAASRYGNPVSYTPADRATNAIDGNPSTAWRVAAFAKAEGEFLQLRLNRPVTVDHIAVLQSLRQGNRWITGLDASFDGGAPVSFTLDDTSRAEPGQRLNFPSRKFRTLRLTVTRTNLGPLTKFDGISDVGIAEVKIPGVGPSSEIIRLPVDIVRSSVTAAKDLPLKFLFSRRWSDPTDGFASTEEPVMQRHFEAPNDRDATPFGKVRLAANLPDAQIDALLGHRSASDGGLTAESSGRLAGSPSSRSSSAVDGSPATAWTSPFGSADGSWLQVTYPNVVTQTDLSVDLVADGRHSVPRKFSLTVDDQPPLRVELPPVVPGKGTPRGSVTTVKLPVGKISGSKFRVTIDATTEVTAGGPPLPIAIAELGLPTQAAPAADTPIPSECTADLVTLNGQGIPLKVTGNYGDAAARLALEVAECEGPAKLVEGTNELRTAPGQQTGWDVDLFALAAGKGGAPGVNTLNAPTTDAPQPPSTEVERINRNSYRYAVNGTSDPYWIVLGQSNNDGWRATTSTGVDLGPPTLINGFANGWLVDPSKLGGDVTIDVTWTPQRLIWIALGLSLLGVAICVLLVVRPPRRGSGTPIPAEEVEGIAPQLIDPFFADGPPAGPRSTVLGTLAITGISVLVMPWWCALAVGLVAAIALGTKRGQLVLRVVTLATLALGFSYIVVKQWRNGYRVDFEWMNSFEAAHAPTLGAIALLVADPFIEWLRQRRGRSHTANSTKVDGSISSVRKNSDSVIPD